MLRVRHPRLELFFVGLLILFWELLLIRWTGASVRIVAYFSNFILISAFMGLGAGSLLSRLDLELKKYVLPTLLIFLGVCPILGSFFHGNPDGTNEYIWLGTPLTENLSFLGIKPTLRLHYIIPLITVFTANTFVFLIFGQWVGQLFKKDSTINAYASEIAGSLTGILLFTTMSWIGLSPIVWILLGVALIVPVASLSRSSWIINFLLAVLVLPFCYFFQAQFTWSPYYKIQVQPFDTIREAETGRLVRFKKSIGNTITVNNDFHQQMLDLGKDNRGHEFQRSWARLYDWPHSEDQNEIDGPVLIVGAGSGNDVSSALRNTSREVHAVEIDPIILQFGKERHPEKPYSNSRVKVINTDARSYFNVTDQKYAKVVFGFLDSHTLMSNFSSLRLDNFVYTVEALKRVKEILLPGGTVYLTFDSNTQWIHERFVNMMDQVFDYKTSVYYRPEEKYADGVVYKNSVSASGESKEKTKTEAVLSTDDWPFLYLKEKSIPNHYVVFILIVFFFSLASLFILPKGQRVLKMPYFFLGAGFFLIETSNVVKMSLLFGSTWYVNAVVFAGLLILILLGTLLRLKVSVNNKYFLWAGLFLSCLIAYLVPLEMLLGFSFGLRFIFSTVLFLGPIFFASLLFADFLEKETNLHLAYGSNLLGAMAGGGAEYLSLIFGLKFLGLLAIGFYLIAFLCSVKKVPT